MLRSRRSGPLLGLLAAVVAGVTVVSLTTVPTAAASGAATPGCALPGVNLLCVPDTVVLNGQQLAANRVELLAGNPTLRASLSDLLAQAKPELTQGPWSVMDKTQLPPSGDKHDYMSLAPYYWPTEPQTASNPWGCPYVDKDGEVSPISKSISDKPEWIQDYNAIYQLSLAWYYTGDASYAQRAELDLRTWFLDAATKMNPNLNYAQGIPCQVDGRGIGIIDFAYTLTEVLDAVELLNDGAPGWHKADSAGMTSWSSQFLTWLRTSAFGASEAAETNNHGSFYDMLSAGLALFTGQRSLARSIVLQAETKRIAVQIQASGEQPLELTRTRSWHYFNFNLVALTRLAQIGQHVGVDLWSYQAPDGGSLFAAVNYLIPAATQGQSVWPFTEIDFHQYAAVDVLNEAANAGDEQAKAALAKAQIEPGGDLFPIRPAAEQLDNVQTTP
ncbi:MAG TPA: alginate lyase family protein [Pseudonocardiaceae bacterium]|nr:alginate lyase family protein [Pseudonocardiaceae bacterium]